MEFNEVKSWIIDRTDSLEEEFKKPEYTKGYLAALKDIKKRIDAKENDHDEILKAAIHAMDVAGNCKINDQECAREHYQLSNWLHRLIGLQAEVDAYKKLMGEPWSEVSIPDDDPDDMWDTLCDKVGMRDHRPMLIRFIKSEEKK